ncbi:hypothetical protein Hanom_Chr11g01044801 [Helianthus anomalus]
MSIHQFKRKPNKYGKIFCGNRTQDLLVPKLYPTPKMPLGYKAMGRYNFLFVTKTNRFQNRLFFKWVIPVRLGIDF